MSLTLWQQCLARLQEELPATEFSMWIRPLQADLQDNKLILHAPNSFVLDWVRDKYFDIIHTLLDEICGAKAPLICFGLDTFLPHKRFNNTNQRIRVVDSKFSQEGGGHRWEQVTGGKTYHPNLNKRHSFDNFVEGSSNQLALAAAYQVATDPGNSYNPLFLCGGTGLGKTHLLHAVGNSIIARKSDAKVVYMHSERFVQEMVKALQNNAIEEFKHYYRSVDTLLIDDIQFLANKERSQEEFVHTFNALIERSRQIILTSDCYPKEIVGIKERLKSRFGWGLIVVIESPDLETRVAILMKKASERNIHLSEEVALFIANYLKSNVRELEGSLNRVIANATFTGCNINVDSAREALRDILALQEKLITIGRIQRTVAEYYKININDLLSKRRSRSVARPRQVAMAMAKKLTHHSLPEIGKAFGGRDHTTVIHACRRIEQLQAENSDMKKDFSNLIKTLSS